MDLDAVILGAGPAGLAVANALARGGAQVRVIEPALRCGGSIRTHMEDGWLVETGPNTLQLEGESDLGLLQSYGLGGEIQTAEGGAAQRFIHAQGKLHGLTGHPASLLRSELLTWPGKLRLLSEIFRPRGGYEGETIQAFVTRRFGVETADWLMDPVVSGVHAGDPSRLVMADCFPKIHALEQEHRSILLGLMRGPRAQRRIVGFPKGMQQLADAMAKPLGDALRLGATATLIRKDHRGWNVAWRDLNGAEDGARARHLIVTAPHWQWPSLPFDDSVRPALREWERADAPPVTVVARGYDASALSHPLDGFGYLNPHREKRRVLGCLFPSSVLPRRAPAGKALLCCFIGGARHPSLARLPEAELNTLVDEELATTLGAAGSPEKQWVQRWERSIPQYGPDHSHRVAALEALEKSLPGLRFHGAFRGGISLMQVLRGGEALGRELGAR